MAELSETLQGLIDEEDLDGLLALVSPDEIAVAWCRYNSSEHARDESDSPDWWAVDLFYTSEIFRRVELYRSLILKMAEHASARALGVLAAGPLENFVSNDEGDIQWLEFHCATNTRLRQALAGVWCSNDLSPETLARLDSAAGAPLARLVPRSE